MRPDPGRQSCSSTDLSGSSRLYISVVVAAGVCVVLESLYSISRAPVGSNWLVLAVLTLLSGSFTVRIPGIPARLSVSETFVFAAALLFGPPAATMIVVLDTLVISFWLGRQATPPWSRLSVQRRCRSRGNLGSFARLLLLHRHPPLSVAPSPNRPSPALAAAASHRLLPAQQLACCDRRRPTQRRSPLSVWRQSFLWLSLNYYSGHLLRPLSSRISCRQGIRPSCMSPGDPACSGHLLPDVQNALGKNRRCEQASE